MTPFEQTLSLISSHLNTKLNNNYRKINLQGLNKPNNIRIVVTIFDYNHNYTMEFINLKNFRLFRQDGDPTVEEGHINVHNKVFEKILSNYLV